MRDASNRRRGQRTATAGGGASALPLICLRRGRGPRTASFFCVSTPRLKPLISISCRGAAARSTPGAGRYSGNRRVTRGVTANPLFRHGFGGRVTRYPVRGAPIHMRTHARACVLPPLNVGNRVTKRERALSSMAYASLAALLGGAARSNAVTGVAAGARSWAARRGGSIKIGGGYAARRGGEADLRFFAVGAGEKFGALPTRLVSRSGRGASSPAAACGNGGKPPISEGEFEVVGRVSLEDLGQAVDPTALSGGRHKLAGFERGRGVEAAPGPGAPPSAPRALHSMLSLGAGRIWIDLPACLAQAGWALNSSTQLGWGVWPQAALARAGAERVANSAEQDRVGAVEMGRLAAATISGGLGKLFGGCDHVNA